MHETLTESLAIEFLQTESNVEDAFNFLYAKYRDSVVKQCARHLSVNFVRNHEEAEDAAQEVFLKLHLKIKNFRGDCAFSSWLFSLVLNHCTSQRRKHLVRPQHDSRHKYVRNYSSDEQNGDADFLDTLPTGEINPLDRLILNEALDSMAPNARAQFIGNVVHGHSAHQVCRTLGMVETPANCARVHRSRRHGLRTLNSALRPQHTSNLRRSA